MSRKKNWSLGYLILGVLGLTLASWIIINLAPSSLYLETGVFALLLAAESLIFWGITGRKRLTISLVVLLGGTLLLGRWSMLNILTELLLVILALLISITN